MTKHKWLRRFLLISVVIFVGLSLYWGMLLRRGVRSAETFLASVGQAEQIRIAGRRHDPDTGLPRRVHAELADPSDIHLIAELFTNVEADFDFQASYVHGLQKQNLADVSYALLYVQHSGRTQAVHLVAPDMLFGNLTTVVRLTGFSLDDLFTRLAERGLLIDDGPPVTQPAQQ